MTTARGVADARLGWRVRLLLGAYPPWWRIRYDDEMRDTVLALRDEGRWTSKSAVDLLRGLVWAWVTPAALPSEGGMPARDRRLVPFAAWGLLLFGVGGAAFAKMLEDPPFTVAASQHPAFSWCLVALTISAFGTAAVMGAATVVALVALLRTRPRPWADAKPLLAVPASAAAVALALVLARRLADGPDLTPARQTFAFVGLAAVVGICGVVSTVALMRTAFRVPESRVVSLSRTVALFSVGVLTTAAALSVAAWALVATTQTPSLLQTHQGVLSTPTLLTLCLCLAALVSGAGLCLRATLATLRVSSPRRRSAK
jgi:hypothetical protein